MYVSVDIEIFGIGEFKGGNVEDFDLIGGWIWVVVGGYVSYGVYIGCGSIDVNFIGRWVDI